MSGKPTYEELEKKVQELEHVRSEFSRIESQLQDEIKWRRQLLKESQEGIVILGERGQVVEANAGFAELIGTTPEAVIDLYAWDWDVDHTKDQIMTLAENIGPEGHRFETRFQRQDGTIRDIALSNSCIEYHGKKLIFCICHDITDRKRAEAAIRDNEKKLEKSLTNIPIAAAILNSQQSISFRNNRFIDLFGYTEDDVSTLNDWWEKAYPSEDIRTQAQEAWEKETAAARIHGGPIQGRNFSVTCKNGDIRIVDIDAIPVDGDIIATFIDTTESRQAQQQLRESEETFRVVFSTSPDPIALTRIDDGTYLDVNEGFVNLSGYTKEQLIGRSSLEMNIWKNHRDRSWFVANLLEKGRVENFETEFVGRSGKVIYGLMSGRIIEIDGEKLLLTITRDITARKLTEEKYSTLINEANIGICLAEANSGEILDVNNAFLQMMEYDRDEVIGQSQAKFEAAPISHGNVTAGFAEHRDHASGEVRTVSSQISLHVIS